MTNEDLEKAMQFILEQQAQFAANRQQTHERFAADKQQTDERLSRLEMNMAEMAQALAQMARSQTHMNEVVAVMVDTHRLTEQRLDAFIGVMERYISEGRNGQGPNDMLT
jgi:t-SNARE complex subunit (syntaxin)